MVFSIRFEVEGERTLEQMSNLKPIMSRAIDDFIHYLAEATVQDGRDRAPVDTRAGRRSLKTKKMGNAHHAVVGSLHMLVMEEGRRPGAKMPPPSALAGWLHRKQLQGHLLDATTFVIARSIGEKGIKEKRFLRKAKNKVMKKRSRERQWLRIFGAHWKRGVGIIPTKKRTPKHA